MVTGTDVPSSRLRQVSRPRAAEPHAASLWSVGKDPAGFIACRSPAQPGRTSSATRRPVLEAPPPGLSSLRSIQKPGCPGEVQTQTSLCLCLSTFSVFLFHCSTNTEQGPSEQSQMCSFLRDQLQCCHTYHCLTVMENTHTLTTHERALGKW